MFDFLPSRKLRFFSSIVFIITLTPLLFNYPAYSHPLYTQKSGFLSNENPNKNFSSRDPTFLSETNFQFSNQERSSETTDEDDEDSKNNYLGTASIILLAIVAVMQFKSNLLWSHSRIFRKITKLQELKNASLIRSQIKEEYNIGDGEDQNDRIFSCLYISMAKGKNRLSGRVFSTLFVFFYLVLNVLQRIPFAANEIEFIASSEVYLTLEMSLAVASVTVLGAFRTTKCIKVLVLLAMALVSYGFAMYFSFTRTLVRYNYTTESIYNTTSTVFFGYDVVGVILGFVLSKFYLDTDVSSLAQAINKKYMTVNPLLSRRLEEMKRIAALSPTSNTGLSSSSTNVTATNPSPTSSHWTPEKVNRFVRFENFYLYYFRCFDFANVIFIIGINLTYASWIQSQALLPSFIAVEVAAFFTLTMLFIDEYIVEPRVLIELLKIAHSSPV